MKHPGLQPRALQYERRADEGDPTSPQLVKQGDGMRLNGKWHAYDGIVEVHASTCTRLQPCSAKAFCSGSCEKATSDAKVVQVESDT